MGQNLALFGNGFIATFQLSSAASLNLGRSQNGEWVNRDALRPFLQDHGSNVICIGCLSI